MEVVTNAKKKQFVLIIIYGIIEYDITISHRSYNSVQ